MSFRTDYILYTKNNENTNTDLAAVANLTDTSPEVLSVVFSMPSKWYAWPLFLCMYRRGKNQVTKFLKNR